MQNSIETRGNLCTELGPSVNEMAYKQTQHCGGLVALFTIDSTHQMVWKKTFLES